MRSSSITQCAPTLHAGSAWPTVAPVLCAVHCLAAPLLAAVAPALVDAPSLEWGLLALSVATVATVLPVGARRHARHRYLALALGALAMWTLALAGRLTGLPTEWVITAASLTTAAALLGNLRRLRRDDGPTAADCGLDATGCVQCRP